MNENLDELALAVKESFGVDVTEWGEQEHFDASNMITVHEDKTETVSSKGSFTVYNFIGNQDNRYKLAKWSDELPEDEELVTYMKNAEESVVKDYVQIQPKDDTKIYSLYRLIPYTVNGAPQW